MRLMSRAGVGLVALCAAVLMITTFKGQGRVSVNQEDVQLPVTVKQLQAKGGVVPVELLCGPASVTTPNRLNHFSCDLKNNAGRNITGANVAYSIVTEQGGKEFKDTRFHTLVTSIDPDFYERTKSLLPGEIILIRPPGSFTYEDAAIKGVEIHVDYVEFEDNTSLGPNENGSQYIQEFRAGASKLKKWLAEKSRKESLDAAIQVLEGAQPLAGPEFGSVHQEYGAKYYRRRLKKMYETRGRAAVQKHLSM